MHQQIILHPQNAHTVVYLVCGNASLVRRADIEIHGSTLDAVKLAECAAFGYWERHDVTGLGQQQRRLLQ